jgi:hypothetical protein
LAGILDAITSGLKSLGNTAKSVVGGLISEGVFGSSKPQLPRIFGPSQSFQSSQLPDAPLKIKQSSAFDEKLSNIKTPVLFTDEFQVEKLRGEDVVKSADRIHAGIIRDLNLVNQEDGQAEQDDLRPVASHAPTA